MTAAAAAATALAFLLDAVVAEPPAAVHPVAAFGRLAGACDRRWRRPRAAGFAAALFLPLSAAAIAGATVRVAALTPAPAVVAAVLAGLWLFAATSRRMLLDVSREVLADVRSDTERARESIRALVGRDAAALSPAELRSGVVESAAENLADGLVAPLLAFALGAQVSLSLAAAAAVWVKAVNTLDSMLGYPSKPHGTASARLDDLVVWVPARVSAVLLAAAAADPAALARGARWAPATSSPNSGWPMATLAAALDVRLAKPGAYALNEGGAIPTDARAVVGVRVVDRAALLAFALAGVSTLLGGGFGVTAAPALLGGPVASLGWGAAGIVGQPTVLRRGSAWH